MTTENAKGFNFEAVRVTAKFNGITKRNDWECFAWSVQIGTPRGTHEFQYYMGMGHIFPKSKTAFNPSGKPKPPSVKDVLNGLLLDAQAGAESFDDFCDNFGYDSDSIKALDVYRACMEARQHFNRLFSHTERDLMAKALEDY